MSSIYFNINLDVFMSLRRRRTKDELIGVDKTIKDSNGV